MALDTWDVSFSYENRNQITSLVFMLAKRYGVCTAYVSKVFALYDLIYVSSPYTEY